jgi:hypothetical protein
MKTAKSSKSWLPSPIEKNNIASLTIPRVDIAVTNHEQKTGIIWYSFKNRMDVSDFFGIS